LQPLGVTKFPLKETKKGRKTHPLAPPFFPLEGSAKGEKTILSPLSPKGLCPPRGMMVGSSH